MLYEVITKMNADYTSTVTNDSGLIGVHYLNSRVDLASANTVTGAGISGLDSRNNFV